MDGRQEKRHPGVGSSGYSPAADLLISRDSGTESKLSKAVAMKKSMPFNRLIDQSSIVVLDEEWLYNYPSFFRAEEMSEKDVWKSVEQLRELDNTDSDIFSAIIEAAKHSEEEYFTHTYFPFDNESTKRKEYQREMRGINIRDVDTADEESYG
ncbi:hypothetical protein CTRI78_v011831 [Colletotrichum trifolii]|uniref:Uncharacterized protein n=1 Tax=Colletotrichum trifolii TaxID=5466 RepID=A0A4R8Q097_COLTR|nr:hypothetical protein CTRI78_v011831 [Colletotrichum trifolii]